MKLKVLMISSEWPSVEYPYSGQFVATQANHLKYSGIELEVFHYSGKKNPINYLKYIFQVKKIVKNSKFDLVHCQFGQSGVLGLFTGLPMVITYRGTDLNGYLNKKGKEPFKSKVLRKLSCLLAKKANAVITVSKALTKNLPVGIDFEVLPSGINLNHFIPKDKKTCRDNLNLTQSEIVVFFPANPDKKIKRFELAEQAFLIFQNQFPNSKLLTAGNIPFEEMTDYYNASDLVIFTSAREGSPNAIKEAMACNTPIVTVNVGDTMERLQGVKGNYLVEADPIKIAQAMCKVVSEGKSSNSRDAIMHLDEYNITLKLISIYKNLIVSHERKE